MTNLMKSGIIKSSKRKEEAKMLTEMTILVLAVTNLILVRAVCNLLKHKKLK